MIKYSELESIFISHDLLIHEYNIETDEEIELPYIVYNATDGDNFSADGFSYFKILTVSLAIIDETMNFGLQRNVEDVLDSNTVFYDKQINFDDEARLYSITYTFSVQDDATY